MLMAVSDTTFLIVFGSGMLAFSVMSLLWRGVLFFPLVNAVFWILFGIWCRICPTENFMFMREIGVIFIGCGIAWLWGPWWLKAKDQDIAEMDAPDDIKVWEDSQQRHRDRVDRHKGIRRRGRQ